MLYDVIRHVWHLKHENRQPHLQQAAPIIKHNKCAAWACGLCQLAFGFGPVKREGKQTCCLMSVFMLQPLDSRRQCCCSN